MEAAQISRELAPHYFLGDCFGNLEGTDSTLFSNRLFLRELKFGGKWLHIIFWQIVLEAAQIWRELAPRYFLADCFENLERTGSTLFSGGWFRRQLKFGGNWLKIIFRQIVLKLKFGGNWIHIIFQQIVVEAAQIWRGLDPYYFSMDCFGGSSNLEGPGSTLFSGGLFWKFGGN